MSEGKARSWVSYPGGLGFGGSSPHAQPLCDGLWLRMKWAGPAAPGEALEEERMSHRGSTSYQVADNSPLSQG